MPEIDECNADERTEVPGSARTSLRAYFQFDPRDKHSHGFRHVVTGGLWLAVCPGFVPAKPTTLRDPTDDDPRCQACLIVLGTEVSDRTGDRSWSV